MDTKYECTQPNCGGLLEALSGDVSIFAVAGQLAVPAEATIWNCEHCGAEYTDPATLERLHELFPDRRIAIDPLPVPILVAPERKPLSRRLRFEVFKRDDFRCVYCGATPLQSALHVDHVQPVAEGGSDDPANLVTACASCNLGKSSVPLDKKKLAGRMVTDADLDHPAQIKQFLEIQRQINQAKAAVVDELLKYWEDHVGDVPDALPGRLPHLIKEWGFECLVEAIDIVARNDRLYSATQCIKYFHGVLRRWRDEGGGD